MPDPLELKIIPLESFKNDFKKLQKRYRHIKEDVKKLTTELQENPKAGIALQRNCYKIRLANSSVPTGKSGGFRTIYYFLDAHKHVYLMAIYSKTQKENISESELLALMKVNGLD